MDGAETIFLVHHSVTMLRVRKFPSSQRFCGEWTVYSLHFPHIPCIQSGLLLINTPVTILEELRLQTFTYHRGFVADAPFFGRCQSPRSLSNKRLIWPSFCSVVTHTWKHTPKIYVPCDLFRWSGHGLLWTNCELAAKMDSKILRHLKGTWIALYILSEWALVASLSTSYLGQRGKIC